MKTERATEARIKNFTPLLDDLVQKYGIVTASVWGRVWRYAQQENHVCQASHEKIASELGISSRTIIRHLHILVENGYLTDHTPGLKNVPHTYSITQKARILITVEGVTESHTGMTESPSGMTESPSGYDRESHEETIKETIKKHINTQEILEVWKTLFPEKPQPKPATISEKLKTRMQNDGFRDNWKAALERGANTKILHVVGWFNLPFFLRNDENFQKVLDGWMDWKDEEEFQHKPTQPTQISHAPAHRKGDKGLYL